MASIPVISRGLKENGSNSLNSTSIYVVFIGSYHRGSIERETELDPHLRLHVAQLLVRTIYALLTITEVQSQGMEGLKSSSE